MCKQWNFSISLDSSSALKFLLSHAIMLSGCLATATVIASIQVEQNKGIEIIEIPHAYIFTLKISLRIMSDLDWKFIFSF